MDIWDFMNKTTIFYKARTFLSFLEVMQSLPLGICIKVELMGHMEEVCLVFSRFCQINFRSYSIISWFYWQYITILVVSHSCHPWLHFF